MTAITVRLLGTPVAFARTRIGPRGHLFTPSLQRNATAAMRLAAEGAMREAGATMLDEPLAMDLLAEFLPPASWSKKKQGEALLGIRRPGKKPDIDNLVKLVGDAMTGIVFRDDCLIVELYVRKIYGTQPKIVCTVRPLLRQIDQAEAAE